MTERRVLLALSVLVLAAAGCDSPPSPTDGGAPAEDAPRVDGGPTPDGGGGTDAPADAGPTSGTLIDAATGGVAGSTDGHFFLFVPPGALAADTTITIERLATGAAPAEASGAAGGVYEVGPAGLSFSSAATTIAVYDTAPTGLVAGDDLGAMGHFSLGAGGDVERHPTTTRYEVDGRVLVLGETTHLSPHWDEVDGGSFRVRLDMPDEGVWSVGSEPEALVSLLAEGSGTASVAVSVEHGVDDVVGHLVPLVPDGGSTREGFALGALIAAPGSTIPRRRAVDGYFEDEPVTLGAGDVVALDADPAWRCEARDVVRDAWVAVVDEDAGRFGDRIEKHARIGCYDLGEIFLAETRRASAGPSGVELAPASGAAANVEVPNAASRAAKTPLAGGVLATRFESVAGAPVIAMTSETQNVTATYAGTAYGLTGLTATAGLGPAGTMTVVGTPPGAASPLTFELTAPAPITMADELLDTPDGLDTTISWPVDDCDWLIVVATLAGEDDSSKYLRRVRCDEAEVIGGRATTRLFPEEDVAAFDAAGLRLLEVVAGVANAVDCSALFPEEISVVSCLGGRMMILPRSALFPYVAPVCGGPRDGAAAVNFCFDFATSACATSGGANPCPTGTTLVGRFRFSARDFEGHWPIGTTSHGTITDPDRVVGIPDGVDVEITEEPSVSSRLTLGFRVEGTVLTPTRAIEYVE